MSRGAGAAGEPSVLSAEVIAVGDELLAGDIVNSNAAWLGRELAAVGVSVMAAAAVPDRVEVIVRAIREASARADVVVVCGGLGPTQDDLTRDALAVAAGVALRRDAGLEAALRERFAASGRVIPEMNFRQADVPEGARALDNPAGTAPGLRMALGSAVVYLLPGPPHEMTAVARGSVLAELAARGSGVVVTRLLHTAGVWESMVAEAMAPQVQRLAGDPTTRLAFLASGGQTRVKITASGAGRDEALARIEPVERFAREALGEAIYGADDDTLEGVVVAALRAGGQTVACAESLTAGMLSARIADVAGASAVLRGGITAYATDLKADLLGVGGLELHGAVSEATAAAMAEGARRVCGADWGVALTGVAGPQPQEGHPPGTVCLGLAGPTATQVRTLALPGDRPRVRTYAVVAALDLLRRTLAAEGRDR